MRYLILIFLAFTETNAQSQTLQQLTVEQWREDVQFLKSEIEKNHISPFDHLDRNTWEQNFEAFDKDIATLSYEQRIVRLISLAASVGDGHTSARPYEFLQRYPITLMWFGKELRVIRSTKDNADLRGAIVTKINGTPVDVAIEKVKPLVPAHESPTFVLGWSEYLLTLDEILVGTGIKKSGALKLTATTMAKKTITVELTASPDVNQKIWAYQPLPLYLSKSDQSPWYDWLPGVDNVLYFNFERYPEWNQMRSFGMGLIQFIKEHDVKKLIVDVREDGGGDFKKGLRLIEELQKTNISSPGKVFVVIGRNTFSAGMSNAAHFKTMLGATLVGERTGARPVGYQENYSFTLPNSKIPASCAIKKYEFLMDDTDGIIPDKEILPDFNLYKVGRDAAIEWILEQ